MNQYNWDEIYKLSVEMLSRNATARRMIREHLKEAAFFREYRTIQMGAGRQNGKTQWMLREVSQSESDILIVRAAGDKGFCKRHHGLKEEVGVVNLDDKLYTIRDIQTMLRTKPELIAERVQAASRIFLDDASRMMRLETLIKLVAPLVRDDVIIVAMG